MENAVDAIKIAFAVFIFTLALALAFLVVGQAKATSDIVLAMTDKTNDYEYVSISDNNSQNNERIVGFETILPVIYRYAKEQYAVTIVKKDGTPIVRYDLYTEGFMQNWDNIYKKKDVNPSREHNQYLDVQERIAKVDVSIKKYTGRESALWNSINHVNTNHLYAGSSVNSTNIHVVSPWVGNASFDAIERIKADLELNGTYTKNGITYKGKNLSQYKDSSFKEVFLEVQTNGKTIVVTDDENNTEYSLDTIVGNKKLEIIYILQEN